MLTKFYLKVTFNTLWGHQAPPFWKNWVFFILSFNLVRGICTYQSSLFFSLVWVSSWCGEEPSMFSTLRILLAWLTFNHIFIPPPKPAQHLVTAKVNQHKCQNAHTSSHKQGIGSANQIWFFQLEQKRAVEWKNWASSKTRVKISSKCHASTWESIRSVTDYILRNVKILQSI